MMNLKPAHEKEISSAEMTGAWRCDEPLLSCDAISIHMVTQAGLQKARGYQETQYPLAPRHFSLRAGYFLKEICTLMRSHDFDALISMGSGLSLLTHCVVTQCEKKSIPCDVMIFDSDLEYMINARIERLERCKDTLPNIKVKNIQQQALDIQEAYQQSLLGKKRFRDFFPANVKKPIFILEGIAYFLTLDCIQWIFDGLKTYEKAAVIFDYWPINAKERSAFFVKVLEYFNTSLPENVQCILSPTDLVCLSKEMRLISDKSIAQIETEFLDGQQRLLVDENNHIPAHVRVLLKP